MKVNGQHYEAAAMAIMQLVTLPTEHVQPMLAKLFRNMEAKGAREALSFQGRMLKEKMDNTAVALVRGALKRQYEDIQKRLKQLGEC